MKLYAPSTIKEIKERYGFRLSKSLGQNFLTDKHIIDRIIEAADIDAGDLIIEIGPGIGVLTREAAERAGRVVAVEIDRNLLPILEETLAGYDNVEVVNADILKTDVNRIIAESDCRKATIIGNLPYYITTPIIMNLLERGVKADSMIFMMQKEVADRIRAGAGSKTYGALSVAVQYYCSAELVTMVPKEVFFPAPKVDSAVLKLHIRKDKPVELNDEAMFFRCIKAGFGQRRKTLANSLQGIGGIDKEEVKECLRSLGIEENRRAETLSIEEFAAIANYFAKEQQG